MGAMAGGQGAAEGVGLTDDTLRGSNDVPTRPVAHRTARWSGGLAALIDTLYESPEEVVWPGTGRHHVFQVARTSDMLHILSGSTLRKSCQAKSKRADTAPL